MSKWKWTTKVGLAVAVAITLGWVAVQYQYATEHDLFVNFNEGALFFNLLLWWLLVKSVLDAAVWLRRKTRPGLARPAEEGAPSTITFGPPSGAFGPPTSATPLPANVSQPRATVSTPPQRVGLALALRRFSVRWTVVSLVAFAFFGGWTLTYFSQFASAADKFWNVAVSLVFVGALALFCGARGFGALYVYWLGWKADRRRRAG